MSDKDLIAEARERAPRGRGHGEFLLDIADALEATTERARQAEAELRDMLRVDIPSLKAERDAALAAVERVAVEIEAVAGGITSSSEAAGYRNGLLRAAQIARAALDVHAMTHYPEFDLWLAEVERAAAEKAWDEGANAVTCEWRLHPERGDAIVKHAQVRTRRPANPYRKEQGNE